MDKSTQRPIPPISATRKTRWNHYSSAVRRTGLLLALLSAAMTAAGAEPAWLETVRGLHPYAGLTVTDDSNLLRLPDAAIRGAVDPADRYLTLEAGLDAELTLSRQRLLIDGRIYRNSYRNFDSFDHTAGDARILWKWLRGRLWEGELGYRFDRKMRDFSNRSVPRRDMIDRHRVFGSAKRWVTDDWRFGANAGLADISLDASPDLDKQRLELGAVMEYVAEGGTLLGLQADWLGVDFTESGERDFDDTGLYLTARWEPTVKSRLETRLGYLWRRHDHLTGRDFDGFAGRIVATWKATDKTSLVATLWRDLSNLDDELADYALIEGIRLEPRWAITSKLSLRALVSFEERDFQLGEAAAAAGAEARLDEITAFALWLDWQAARNTTLSLGWGKEERDSNRLLADYDYRYLQARLVIGI